MKWAETDRETLRATLPEALVLLPIGATEQHGPHLATGTDALLATTVCEWAADLAAPRSARPLVVAPPLPFGASDHHLPFGGTLSLGPETLLAVLGDLARSIATQGGRRLVVVNGHGGNTGIARAFAAAAASRHGLSVACVDYWELIDPGGHNLAGHAGEFETALMLALRPELVREPPVRAETLVPPKVEDVAIFSAATWHALDGYTDLPDAAGAERGRRWLDTIVATFADRLVELGKVL